MNADNTRKLYEAFPHLYRGRFLSAGESSMSWGFECGDGWLGLIWALSQEIEDAARQDGLDPRSGAWPEATQVKSKAGTLRFHLRHDTATTTVLRNQTLLASQGIDEISGAPTQRN